MLNPKTSQKVVCSVGVIAFIDAQLDYINSLNSDIDHGKDI